jgi:hypothetical protein
MDFLDKIATFGTLQAKPVKRQTKHDQLARMRESFIAHANRQILALKDGSTAKGSKWYIAYPTDADTTEYALSLRNGVTQIPLSGDKKYVRVPSADRAIDFFEQAAAACADGQLDEALKATRRKGPSAMAIQA